MGGAMSSIVISGDTSGSVALTVPTVAGSNTVTIAAQTGTLNAAGPTFSAYQSSQQSIPNATFTKLQFQTEIWDTNNNFDSTTNYRFTPTVAGYYQINAAVQYATAIGGIQVMSIYKNNQPFLRSQLLNTSTSYGGTISGLVYANGSTDYFEIFCYQGAGSSQNTDAGTSAYIWFQGALVRGA